MLGCSASSIRINGLVVAVFGGIAQLVERCNGIAKVTGSTPVTSTSLPGFAFHFFG